jgi:hypothetical protein
MYGKDVPIPRMEVWVADHAYTYSRRTYQPISWTPTLLKVKAEVEAGGKCNSVLAICHNMHLRDAWEWAVALNIRSALGRWLSVWRFNYIIYGNDALTVVPVEELRSKSISEGLRVAPRAPTSSNIFCVPTSKTISLDKGRLSG